jgi:periplasmic protein TonB
VVRPRPGNPKPTYPPEFAAEQRQGEVLLEFVVRSSGRVDTASITVLYSDHPLFTAAARAALKRARYEPAAHAGRAVRQRTRQPFSFRTPS